MDNLEFTILSELCSTNYSELLSTCYESYYRPRCQRDTNTLVTLLASQSPASRKDKDKTTEDDPFNMSFNHRILSILTDFDFKYHFKVSKSTVEVIIQLFERTHTSKRWVGRPSIEISRSVLIGLWYLVSNEPYRMLCDRFSTAIGHSNHTVRQFLQTMSHFRKEFISWPKRHEMNAVQEEFEEVTDKKLPGVVGCIDSCQIKTRRNKFRLLGFVIMQVVCDAKMRITDEWSGDGHQLYDSCVFTDSDLYKQMISPGVMSEGQHILGDSRFPLLTNLMTPYPQDQLDPSQLHYNNVLSAYRQIVIDTMRALFGRFSRLGFLDLFKTTEITNAVTTCCIIHNICLSNNDPLPLLPDETVLGTKGITDMGDEDHSAQAKRYLLTAQMMSEMLPGESDDQNRPSSILMTS